MSRGIPETPSEALEILEGLVTEADSTLRRHERSAPGSPEHLVALHRAGQLVPKLSALVREAASFLAEHRNTLSRFAFVLDDIQDDNGGTFDNGTELGHRAAFLRDQLRPETVNPPALRRLAARTTRNLRDSRDPGQVFLEFSSRWDFLIRTFAEVDELFDGVYHRQASKGVEDPYLTLKDSQAAWRILEGAKEIGKRIYDYVSAMRKAELI